MFTLQCIPQKHNGSTCLPLHTTEYAFSTATFFVINVANDQSTSVESEDAQYTGQITSDKKHIKGTDFSSKTRDNQRTET